ncbi:hypothetical protein FRC11_002888 [Ceratobasidium sp. 423]|nr:hypothetical protein FRC11_002888 [Ceratobasidium sp. 423]
MILTNDKTGSTETKSQAHLPPQPSLQTNPFESTSSTAVPHIPTSDNHESLQEMTAQPPPTYSPSFSNRERPAGMFITNGRPASTVDLIDSSGADRSTYPREKAHLPEYSETIATEASIQGDGRIQASFAPSQGFPDGYMPPIYEPALDEDGFLNTPAMSINIMIVGSRGDVQPYIALGQQLQEYGHIVRISTHAIFRPLVKDAGLMFFNIGGDPNELAEYLARNPGLVPGLDSVKNGDIGKNQNIVAEVRPASLRRLGE